MDTITITNPVRQHRLEGWIKATEHKIEHDRKGIAWAQAEIEWAETQRGKDFWAWACAHQAMAKWALKNYQEELTKDLAHLKELQTRLSEEIEKPL